MNWQTLSEWQEEKFYRGTVFRFPAIYPFENIVDFMIIEDFDTPLRLKLICSTGYHAGQTELIFPTEASHHQHSTSVDWVKKNWNEWIYPHCYINDVKIIEQYTSDF